MKNIVLFCLCILVSVPVALKAQYQRENLKLDPPAMTSQGMYTYQNLQLYPVRANQAFRSHHKGVAKYVTLKEALEKRKVAITEQKGGGDVNTLFIENVSADTIIVLSGEVVQGGKQDRVIAQDFVLYPKSGKKDVSVFCVEQGRWSPKDGDTSFKQYYTISSNEVRKAATVKKNQREVWNKVSETTEKNKAGTATGTLTALKGSASLTNDLKKYTDHFQPMLSRETDIIGVVAVSGSVILGCDMFASHDIFVKYLSSLLSSYATEAITSGKPVNLPYYKVEEYLQSIIADESKQEKEVEKKGTMLKDGNKKIHISTF
jgi:hypothetical protein